MGLVNDYLYTVIAKAYLLYGTIIGFTGKLFIGYTITKAHPEEHIV